MKLWVLGWAGVGCGGPISGFFHIHILSVARLGRGCGLHIHECTNHVQALDWRCLKDAPGKSAKDDV